MKPRSVADIRRTLAARCESHGDFARVAQIAEALLAVKESAPNWRKLSPARRAALRQMAFKEARILCGDPDHEDHWRDIGGYAELGRRG